MVSILYYVDRWHDALHLGASLMNDLKWSGIDVYFNKQRMEIISNDCLLRFVRGGEHEDHNAGIRMDYVFGTEEQQVLHTLDHDLCDIKNKEPLDIFKEAEGC